MATSRFACPTCKRARCQWVELKPNPAKVPTRRLETVVSHNISYIDMIFKDGGSAAGEERMYGMLTPYTDELEKRGKKK